VSDFDSPLHSLRLTAIATMYLRNGPTQSIHEYPLTFPTRETPMAQILVLQYSRPQRAELAAESFQSTDRTRWKADWRWSVFPRHFNGDNVEMGVRVRIE
jgi:hypothetical protein